MSLDDIFVIGPIRAAIFLGLLFGTLLNRGLPPRLAAWDWALITLPLWIGPLFLALALASYGVFWVVGTFVRDLGELIGTFQAWRRRRAEWKELGW